MEISRNLGNVTLLSVYNAICVLSQDWRVCHSACWCAAWPCNEQGYSRSALALSTDMSLVWAGAFIFRARRTSTIFCRSWDRQQELVFGRDSIIVKKQGFWAGQHSRLPGRWCSSAPQCQKLLCSAASRLSLISLFIWLWICPICNNPCSKLRNASKHFPQFFEAIEPIVASEEGVTAISSLQSEVWHLKLGGGMLVICGIWC